MRVRVSYTVDVDDNVRRGMRRYYGRPGLATREEVQDWFKAYGDSMNDDIPTPGTPYMGDDEGPAEPTECNHADQGLTCGPECVSVAAGDTESPADGS